jgi:glucokinase
MYPYVVADIGGTNARFALVTGRNDADDSFELTSYWNQPCSLFTSFEQAVSAYINTLDPARPERVCVAIAGPVHGDRVCMTNRQWTFSIADVTRQLNLKRLDVINDFVALAHATPYLGEDSLSRIKTGIGEVDSAISVIGPGTGFGVSFLVPVADGWHAFSSEGGHIALAPGNPLEQDIVRVLGGKSKRVTIESVLSGPGLENLYMALVKLHGEKSEPLSARQIAGFAGSQDEGLCHKTLSVFCSLLGSVSGDLALAFGARRGVFLAGGILPRLEQFLLGSQVIERFLDKGLMSSYVKNIPVNLITARNAAHIGSAVWMARTGR